MILKASLDDLRRIELSLGKDFFTRLRFSLVNYVFINVPYTRLNTLCLLHASLDVSSALKLEAIYSIETSVNFD